MSSMRRSLGESAISFVVFAVKWIQSSPCLPKRSRSAELSKAVCASRVSEDVDMTASVAVSDPHTKGSNALSALAALNVVVLLSAVLFTLLPCTLLSMGA